jgi:alpha-L-fucosidase
MNIDEVLFNKIFQAKLGEFIDEYQPDLIWFDGQMQQIKDPYHLQFLAYYFNQAKKRGREVVVTTKKRQYPPEISVLDFEKGRTNELTDYVWLTDDTVSTGSWSYTNDLEIKSTDEVLDTFVDIVSKNGCLLLNISPKADGTIPDDQRELLLGMGGWLRAYGEAVYDTRPWRVFGEGPTRLEKTGAFVGRPQYTAEDVRFTRTKDGKALYVIFLGWPGTGETATLTSFATGAAGAEVKVADVELLGSTGAIEWKRDEAGLSVTFPDSPPAHHKLAVVFKVSVEK